MDDMLFLNKNKNTDKSFNCYGVMNTTESLFSLEVHVESVNRLKVSCVIPAVSFRLLDFPTLIIHHVSPANVLKLREKAKVQGITKGYIETELRDRYGNIPFSKGKSCLFKANIEAIQQQLQVTPLYVMVLDLWPKKPKLVGSTMIPLKKTIDKVAADVERTGVSVPSISQLEGTYEVYNLMGSVIGHIKLALRILSLGGCLTPHIPARSIMTRESGIKMEQKERNAEEGEVVLEDLEGISLDDEPTCQPPEAPLVQSAGTQTTVPVPKACKSVVPARPPYEEDIVTEPAIIANTVCPPPLYYHFMSHAENTGKESERKKVKESKSKNGIHRSDDVDFTYYNPDLVQPDGSCGCASVYVQTEEVQDCGPNLPITNDEPVQSGKAQDTRINSEDLPLLSALLEELTYLRAKRGDGRMKMESVSTKETIVSTSKEPPKAQTKVRDCCAQIMAEKSGVFKKQSTNMGVLTPKRVKFKRTSLTHGMTRTHLMRLEMNQRGKRPTSRLCSVGNDAQSIASNVSDKQPSNVSDKQPSRGKKPYALNFKRDLGRTQTLFPQPAVEERNVVSTEVQTDNGFGRTMVLTKDQEEDKNVVADDGDSRTSSQSLSSHKSVEIYLPQVEGESDSSDVFDVTNLDEDRFAPQSTYKKYGHTGIPHLPSKKNPNQSHFIKRGPDQSEKTSLHQSDLTKKTDQSESPRKSPDQSEPTSSPAPGSTRKSPDLGRRRSVTSQAARSRTSTALSMYSDDFEECPVWNSASDDGSYDSSSHTSYHSANSQDKERDGRDNPHKPTQSYYSPLKSQDLKKSRSSICSTSEEGSLPPDEQQSLKTTNNKEQFYDSLNSAKSREEMNDSETEDRDVLQLPKPANNMGYTY